MAELIALIVTNDKGLENLLKNCLRKNAIAVRTAQTFDEIQTHIDNEDCIVSTIIFDIPEELQPFEQDLRAFKRNKIAKYIPCIGILNDIARSDSISHQLFFHILALPLHDKILPHTIEAAQSDFKRYQALFKEVSARTSAIELIRSGEFSIRTLKEAEALTTMLSLACPEPAIVALGLSELLVNAIEHGNLNISYEEKSKLLESGKWNLEIEKRLKDARYKKRSVEVMFNRMPDCIKITICDEGDGFDWKKYISDDPDKGTNMHGRGIAVAVAMGFSELTYNNKGNQVTAVIKL